MYEFIYIMAISLQLAGALVLVVNFWNGKLKNTVAKGLKDEESVLHWIEVDEDSQSITYSPEEQQKVANRVLRNRFAFIYIAIGYLLGVIGDRGDKVIDFFAVIVFGVAFIILCWAISYIFAKKKFDKDLKVTV